MKKILNTIALVSLAMAAVAAPQSNLRKSIDMMNKQVCAAMKKKDMKAFEAATKAGVTSDFKYVEGPNSMSYDQMVKNMKMSMGMFKKVNVVTAKVKTLKEKGSSAEATSTHHIEAMMVGPDKKTHKLVADNVSKETYKKVGKDWKLAVMEMDMGKMTMDGKPFDMSKMGGN